MRAREEMRCRELVEVLTEYLEGTLSEHDRARMEAHLASCPECSIYLDQLRQTIAALGELCEESIGSDTRERLLAAFRDWRGAP